MAALRAGLPVTTPGVTVNRFCNSGLQAIVQAAHMVLQEDVDAAIGGGVESITMMQRDTSPNPWVSDRHPGVYMAMGETAEVVAKRYGVTREAQDELSLVSQQRIARAQQDGFFRGEIAPIDVTRAVLDKKTGAKVGEEAVHVDRDECNRADTTFEGLAKLPPVFDATSGKGSVTAGNSSQLSDGASATLVMSAARAKALGIEPMLIFRGYAVAACEPDEMGIGPVFAVPKLLKKQGLKVDDVDSWELNEAFASQVVYCRDRLGNPHGAVERQRRIDRHRSSVRHDRFTPGGHDRRRDGPTQGALRRGDDVRGRRARRGCLVRTRMTSHEIRLASRPKGWPTADTFAAATVELPPLAEGEVLVRNLFMSVDPYMRGRMNDVKSYVPPFQVGHALEGGAIGEVVESRAAEVKPGDIVLSVRGWRDYFIARPADLRLVDPQVQPLSGTSARLACLASPHGSDSSWWIWLGRACVRVRSCRRCRKPCRPTRQVARLLRRRQRGVGRESADADRRSRV